MTTNAYKASEITQFMNEAKQYLRRTNRETKYFAIIIIIKEGETNLIVDNRMLNCYII